MNSLNKAQIIGNVTMDPEVRETPNGQKVANFSVATNRVWKDASGAKQEAADYHNVVAWGKLAEIIEHYLTKGKKVYVEWRMQTKSWDDPSGSKRYKTEIVAESVILLSRSASGSEQSEPDDVPEFQEEQKKPARRVPKREEEIDIGDIPF